MSGQGEGARSRAAADCAATVTAAGVEIVECLSNLRMLYCDEQVMVAARGYDIITKGTTGNHWIRLVRLPRSPTTRLVCGNSVLARLARSGVRAYEHLKEGGFIAVCDRRVILWRPTEHEVRCIGRIRQGSGPLYNGCCSGAQGDFYYGEYFGNPKREEVSIWRWTPESNEWRAFYTFPAGSVRHVHAVQFDPYSERIWVATGDADRESMIGYFDGPQDRPVLNVIACGSQRSRAVSLIFTPGHVYWGSDAGRDSRDSKNGIFRFPRRGGLVEQLAELCGPAYYSTADSAGNLYVATAVEGSASELDNYARLWMSAEGTKWAEIGRWRKDPYPLLFGHGVLSFPKGTPSPERVYLLGNAVVGGPATWVLKV